MKTMRFLVAVLILAFAVAAQGDAAQAQSTKPSDTPSIMTPEPGASQKAHNARSQGKKTGQPAKQAKERDESEPPKRRKRRIGSGSSPLPAYQSPLTPLGTAPSVIETPAAARVPGPPAPVPGFATVPPPPAALSGQSFPDKAIGCVHHGTSSGVGPAEIGSYTGSCVNTR